MFTQIITFLIIVAIIGCIMYARKLIRTQKVDAVYGNPERIPIKETDGKNPINPYAEKKLKK